MIICTSLFDNVFSFSAFNSRFLAYSAIPITEHETKKKGERVRRSHDVISKSVPCDRTQAIGVCNKVKEPAECSGTGSTVQNTAEDSGVHDWVKMNSSTKADSLPLTFDYSCSPVSSKHHFCGSLFAKCAQHGKWQLLQTFTNRESDLSQETFSDAHSPRIIRRSYEPVRESRKEESNYSYGNFAASKSEAQQMPPYLTDENLSGIASQRDGKINKNRVKFANKTFECKCLNAGRYGHMRHYSFPVCKNFPSKRILSDLREITASPSIPEENSKSYPQQESKCNAFTNDAKKPNKMFPNVRDEDTKDHQQKYLNRYVPQRSIPKDRIINLEKEKNRIYNNAERDAISDVFRDQQDGQMANGNLRRDQRQTSSLRSAISQRTESTPFENEIDFLETEIVLLRRELKKKDVENVKLQMEIDKLKLPRLCQQSVLNETSVFKHEGDLLSSIHDSHGMPGQVQQVVNIPNPNKKQGVSGESSNHGENHHQIEIQRFEKDFRSKQLIKDAIMENNFLKNLDMSQVREIVESVYPKEFSKDDYVIREGEAGSHLFVSAEGELEVIKGEKVLGNMGPGKAFGELAILYNCRRTASIKVVSDAKVWVLDRRVFQKIVMKTGLQRLQENLNFLRSVPLLKSLSTEVLAKIADVLEVDFYQSGEHIIRQGATGDTFFIISSGSVKVTQDQRGKEDEEIRILQKGDYFGEQALLKEDWRTANVIALSPGVECLTLNRDSFIQLIGDLSELQEKDYGDQIRGFVRPSSASNLSDKQEYDYIRLQDLEVINTLGVGGFGRVELVQYTKNRGMTFALKCLKKQHIVETKQQEHVYSEKNIMMSCNSLFICRLYKTFRDSKYVYMLQEALLGGEVWTILREKGCFDDYTTKFVTGCVIEAFEYLHTRGIVYRDLKPENLLLDNKGYIKLVDFGFSKRIGFSSKTWTFCGTPEYLAPEIILNKGHDRAVDYWSLGILMHELLTGIPPFTATDPMRTYTFILKGIDMIDFPKHITKRAQSLIKRLCRDAPSERLGYQRGGIQDIKRHKWFQGFDWEGLKQRVLIPPVSPSVTSSTDTSNFDCYSKETSLPPDEFSNWDAEF